MKNKLLFLIFILAINTGVYSFTHKHYANYNSDAVSDFLWGIFSEQVANTESVQKYYERAYRYSKSDNVMLSLSLEYIRSGNYEEGYKILNGLYDSGFKLGRAGIYLYLNESKNGNKARSADILDRIISELYSDGEIITAAMVLNQKLEDNIFSFTTKEQFEEFLNTILKNEYSRTYKLYFETIAMQFYSRTSEDKEKVSEILTGLENEFIELPYIAYRFAFDEFIYMKDYDKALEVLNKMTKYTLGEAKYYSDYAEYFSSKGDFKTARNLLLDGMKEFPESTLNLQLAALYISKDEMKKAEKIYRNVIEKYPEGSAYIYQVMANEYAKNGNEDASFSSYERALKAHPDDPELLNNYSYQLAESSRDLEKALEYANKAISGKNESITFLDTKAWVLFKMGRYEEAEKIMNGIFSDEKSFYHQSSEELFSHYKEIKTTLNKAGELGNMSINKTAVIISEIISKSNFILQAGF